MTAQNLYNNLKQGKINESQFLREIRHQSHLPITKFNSFKDTIQILKTRGIISEEMGKYKTDKNVFFPKQEIKTIDQVSPHEYAKGINYEMELFDKSVGQNMPTDEELEKAQQKVLRNLSKDEYYYTRKIMTNGQKKQEKQDLDYTELGKETKAKNQMIKGKILKENSDFADPEDEDEDCFSCNRNKSGLITDKMSQEDLAKLSHLIEEWGLTEQDLNDEDIIDELATQFMNDNSRMNEIKVNNPNIPNWERYIKDQLDGWEYEDSITWKLPVNKNELKLLKNKLDENGGDLRINIDGWPIAIYETGGGFEFEVMDEKNDLEEGIALKDKAGNISYVKDDREATDKMNDARQKGIQLTKQNV